VRSLLFNLLDAGEAFPSVLADPARLQDLGNRLLGVAPRSLSDLGGSVGKLVYGGLRERSRVAAALRDEIDWTFARAVNAIPDASLRRSSRRR
jgi:hypothetical protein